MKPLVMLFVVSLLGVLAVPIACASLPEPQDISPVLPLYFDRDIDESELHSRTLVELALMRNWIYARAGNPFRKAWLREFFEQQAWYRPAVTYAPSRLSPVDMRNLATISRYEVSLTEVDLEHHFKWLRRQLDTATEVDGLWRIEGELTAARLGVAFDTDGPESEYWSPLSDPRAWERQLTVSDLENLSRRDLRILRNIIYARRGRLFKSSSLQSYFSTLKWYTPDRAYSDARLSAVDRRNIKLILDIEKKLGGPMGESEATKFFDGA